MAEQDPHQHPVNLRVLRDHEEGEHEHLGGKHHAESAGPADAVRRRAPQESAGAVPQVADGYERGTESGQGGGCQFGVEPLSQILKQGGLEADD